MFAFKLLPGSRCPAVGGPLEENAAEKVTKTRAGRFVVASVGQHISSERWMFSTIPWGAPLRVNAKGHVEVQLHQQWQLLHELPAWSYYASNPAGARKYLEDTYASLMGNLPARYGLETAKQLPAPWNDKLPRTWVFNDFGPVAIKYFIDHNGNRRLDSRPAPGQKREELMSDFLHTTPYNELSVTIDKQLGVAKPYQLIDSHGCVHLDPLLLRRWVARGVLKVGATIQVHAYSEKSLPNSFDQARGRVGTEIHFFPGAQQIALYQVTVKQLARPLHPAHD